MMGASQTEIDPEHLDLGIKYQLAQAVNGTRIPDDHKDVQAFYKGVPEEFRAAVLAEASEIVFDKYWPSAHGSGSEVSLDQA